MMLRIFAMNVTGEDFTAERWKSCLSESRRNEAKKMRREKDRQLFLGAEALLNRSLKLVDAPVSLPAVYTRNRYGKPYLDKTSGIYVNWSHSGSFAICALSDREVGIDLQNTFKTPKSALVRRVLQPEEQIYYDQTPKEQRRQLFYSYWTVKESFLKALGTGFGTPIDNFYVRMEGPYPEVIQREGRDVYACRLLDFKEKDYMAAVCVKGENPEAKMRPEVEIISL
jgi:4'-phosphopantetheinyl transferase